MLLFKDGRQNDKNNLLVKKYKTMLQQEVCKEYEFSWYYCNRYDFKIPLQNANKIILFKVK